MKAELLTLRLLPDQVLVDWPRFAAEKLFIGQSPQQVLQLAPMLFSLCGQAQRLAARLALQQAQGLDCTPQSAELDALVLEAARETIRKVLLDWSLVFDGAPADAEWMARWRQADQLGQLEQLAVDFIFGQNADSWLALAEPGWLDWISRRETAPARWLSSLDAHSRACGFLPELNAWALAAQLDGCLQADGPVWNHQPCEVGALARESAQLPSLLAGQQRSKARLLARLIQLARWFCAQDLPAASAAFTSEGALSLVHTARGPLVHLVSIDPQMRVQRYRVIPPTAWHAHPRGLLQQTLLSLGSAGVQQANREVSLIDPCVAFELIFEPGTEKNAGA